MAINLDWLATLSPPLGAGFFAGFANSFSYGPLIAILLMGIVTYICRFIGFWIIGFFEVGPRLRRSFEILPGCIAASSALPVAVDAGPTALIALLMAFMLMRWLRIEIIALLAALALVAVSRAAGF